MSTTALVTMSAILGFVWGGFLLILVTAVRKERAKTRASGSEPGGGAGR